MIDRRTLVLSLAATAASPQASAQTWPAKPIRIIVPFPAGQATDILARMMAEQLTKALGQQVIAENRPGAGGQIGADVAAKAAPDGYTIAVSLSTSLLINQFLYASLSYDPRRDLVMVSQLATAPVTLGLPGAGPGPGPASSWSAR